MNGFYLIISNFSLNGIDKLEPLNIKQGQPMMVVPASITNY